MPQNELLPAPLLRVLGSTGMRLKSGVPHMGANHMGAIASVEEGSPDTIEIDDPKRFNQARGQTLTHEGMHLWQNNLPPKMQKMIPPDNPADPYNYGGSAGLQKMRAQGKKILDLPREEEAAVGQYYQSQGGKNAPMAVRRVYEPWMDDINNLPLSAIMPTDPNEKGINVTPRPPLPPVYR